MVDKAMDWHQPKTGRMTVDTLRLLPVFRDLGERDLRRLADVATWRAYREGDSIVEPGDARRNVFAFVEGRGRFSCSILDRPDLDIFFPSAGDLIDFISLRPELEAVVHVSVTSDRAIICWLPADLVRQVLFIASRGAAYLDAQREGRLADILVLLIEFAYCNALGRLSHTLADLGRNDPNYLVRETHEGLARRIGTHREVVTRLLKSLKRQRLINYEPHHRGIKVLDVDRLAGRDDHP